MEKQRGMEKHGSMKKHGNMEEHGSMEKHGSMKKHGSTGIHRGIGIRAAMAVLLWFAAAALLAGCGRDTYEVEYGTDGYVYVSKRVQAPEGIEDMRVVGDYLYYRQETSRGTAVSRVSVAGLAAGEGTLDFSGKETLVVYPSLTFDLPEGAREDGEGIDFLSAMDGGYGKSSGVSMEKSYGRLVLEEYAVAPDGTLCLYLRASVGGYFAQTGVGGVLCLQNPQGEQTYRRYVPEMLDIAIDAQGQAIVLMGDKILILDREGNQAGSLSTEEYHAGQKISMEDLFTDSEGRVYYSYVTENAMMLRSTYEIKGKGSFRLEDAGDLLGTESYGSYAAAPGGDVYQFYYGSSEPFLYLYDRETGSRRELLDWTESGLMPAGVRLVAGITPDVLVVSYGSLGSVVAEGVYQLTKTPVDQLPERELLVVAIPGSSYGNLQEAALQFNAKDSAYRVVLESYDPVRLDASLVSSNPPDLLMPGGQNLIKYAKKGLLEDLTPYLEGSSIDREDIPDNAMEGRTFDGKLVSIPTTFGIRGIVMRAAQTEGLDGWSMEDVFRLTQQHPEAAGGLVGDGSRMVGTEHMDRYESSWLLEQFCARYYLEEFIDWEERECSFDSDAFRGLVVWAGTYGGEPVDKPSGHTFSEDAYIPEDMLMVPERLEFGTLLRLKHQYGEEVCLKGYPTKDGGGYFPAVVSETPGICVNSSHKEAAWEFIELYWEICLDNAGGWYIPASKKGIRELYEKETTPNYIEGTTGEDGKPLMREKFAYLVSGDEFPVYYIPQEQADIILAAIETADLTPMSSEEETIVSIVVEEAESYFRGDKSLEEVSGLIQNRVQLILNEGKR